MGKLFVGTSGFSYKDWRGTFYPEDLAARDMLKYYTQVFNCVELNFSYYRIPSRSTIASMVKATPPDFQFTIKANEATTHKQDPSVLDEFKDAIEPAMVEGKMAGILCQFPQSFKNNEENRAYLAQLAKDLRGYDVIVEFRHDSWAMDAVLDFLRKNGLAFCSVDEPELPQLFPRMAAATSDIAYVRFHSRNKGKWYRGREERYDYLYTKKEMREWLPKVQELNTEAERTYIFFNNCHAGSAAINATEFKQMLVDLGLKVE